MAHSESCKGNGSLRGVLIQGDGGKPRPKKRGVLATPNPNEVQLYDIASDSAEKKNVAKEHPEIVQKLKKLLQDYEKSGRSVPGRNEIEDKDEKTYLCMLSFMYTSFCMGTETKWEGTSKHHRDFGGRYGIRGRSCIPSV